MSRVIPNEDELRAIEPDFIVLRVEGHVERRIPFPHGSAAEAAANIVAGRTSPYADRYDECERWRSGIRHFARRAGVSVRTWHDVTNESVCAALT
jgi:hypothetical protein